MSMQLVRATESDNERLMKYFSASTSAGPIQIQTKRMHSFFNQYRIQSDDYVTYLLLNAKNNIEASATIIFRKAWVQGEHQVVGYATDLRVSPTRRAIMEWSNHFLPVLEKERELRNCKYIFSVVAQSQRQAYNAFIRPRTLRRNLPRYHLFRKFSLITMHGLWPLHKRPLPGIKINHARTSDMDALTEYIVQKSSSKSLHYFGSQDDVLNAIKRWIGLRTDNFLIATDHSQNIIGCTAIWSLENTQKIYAQKYSPSAENMRDILNILSFAGLAHRLPKLNSELHIKHLPFLHADNSDIFRSLLYNAFIESHKNDILIYPHFEDDLLMTPPRRFITAKINYGLYCILSPTDSIPDFLKPQFPNPAPSFEAAFM